MSNNERATRLSVSRFAAYGLKIAAIAAFVVWTNEGFLQRIALLQGQGRWVTLIGFVGIWGLSLVAVLVAAFQPHRWLRLSWAVLIGLASAAGFAYHHASGSELGVFDALSLWNARHEAVRAGAFYTQELYWFAGILLAAIVAFAVPPIPHGRLMKRWLTRLAWVPAVPVAAIAAIVLVKEGGGSEVLPSQFTPLSVGLVVGSKVAAGSMPQRSKIAWTWRGPFVGVAPRAASLSPRSAVTQAPGIRRIVLLVDESVRADYIDWTPGNPYTPELAALKSRIVDFGPAASGGNCSHYSNAILRFAAPRDGLGRELLATPTLWQYAKKAGFRTVFVDGQAGFNRNPGKLQNFMTVDEVADIDGFHTLDGAIAPAALDDTLLDIVLKELKTDDPVLIYANKNGAHFPYDIGYPSEARLFRPTMSESPTDSSTSRIDSFRNVVRWSVDRFFKRLLDEASLKDTVIIYTSDHGQAFNPHRLTHCTVEQPDPREALVPLFVITGNEALRARLAEAAAASRGNASHFSIVPAVLELLGYGHDDIARTFGESLLYKNARPPGFTTGDIFGLFADKPRWHTIDLERDYLESDAMPAVSAQANRAAQGEAAGDALLR